MKPVLVTLARDARLHAELYPDQEAAAELHGRIVGRYGRSSAVKFYAFRDASETIQILLDRNDLADDVWDSFVDAREGAPLVVSGRVGYARSGKLSIFPTDVARLIRTPTTERLLEDDINGVGRQLILARLENRCRTIFTQENYEEISSRLLSTSWEAGGLQSLRVLFPGQSTVPFYLAVSPNPQMLRALLVLGITEFFTISRSFATNFIATQNGAEYVIASALSARHSIEEASDFALTIVKHIIGDYRTGLEAADRDEWNANLSSSESDSLEIPGSAGVGLHLHIAQPLKDQLGPGDVPITAAFNIVWRGYLTLAEGYEFDLADGFACVSLTIHIERFLQLLRSTDNRRVADQSKATISFHGGS